MDLKFYTIDKHYIEFLRTYPKLSNVFDNKENTSSFSRKYLGIVLSINELYKNFQRTCPLLQNVSRETITT